MSAAWQSTYGTARVLTPTDGLDQQFSALYIGGAGNITVIMESGETTLFSALPVGTLLPIRGKRVNSTGTTATLIVGLL